ncbi:MAG TPA: ABC transporter substrate-binding protein [Geminicoccaceae bacterium]|nr:ABC transporter substrate-binding protein [Geminicoccus sp.]HMU48770.1 ABC transporter substrate-binding protein [Geminicoccaceae bacterium]
MKKLLGVAFAALVSFGPAMASAKEWTKIRFATEGAYAPFNFVQPDGEVAGFDVDIAKALCDEMKAECTIVKQDWDGMIPALLARKFDAVIASMSITEERKQRVDFTDKYQQTPARLVSKKGSGFAFSPETLKDKKIGVQRETIHDKFATDNWGETAEIVRYGTQDEANLDMVAGRVDLLLADSAALSEGFLKTDAGKDFEFVGPDFTDPKWFGPGAGIAVRKQDKDLTEQLNKAIAAIRANGTYDAIAKKYFDFNVYGS